MNWTRALHDFTSRDDTLDQFDVRALSAAVARDTVYLPSDLAARLIPEPTGREHDAITWRRASSDADRPAPAH